MERFKEMTERRLRDVVNRIQDFAESFFGDEDAVLRRRLSVHSFMGVPALEHLQSLASDLLKRKVVGDFVECGVFNGGSAAVLARPLRSGDRRVWLYDSFKPMPEPSKEDHIPEGSSFRGLYGSPESVKEAMTLAGFPLERCEFRVGWFADTFRLPLPDAVAFLHIDCDWFESVSLALETFYDRVSEGGIIVLDDFGHWEGCRTAYYSFVCARGLAPLLERHGYTRAYWEKGRLNNRDSLGSSGTKP